MRLFRKIFTLIIITVMITGVSCADGAIPSIWSAEPTTASAGSFSFRNGISWDMDRNQVMDKESVQMSVRSNGEWAVLCSYGPVEVSRYFADLVYMFRNDRLKMILYDFGSNGTEDAYAYLTGALTSRYGKYTEPAAAELVGVMDAIYPGYYSADRVQGLKSWAGDGNTAVYLYYYASGSFAIFYVNRGGSLPENGQYNTTGL